MKKLSTYDANVPFGEAAAEISTYEPFSKRLFLLNNFNQRIDVLDIADPTDPQFVFAFDFSPYGAGVNSLKAFDGYVAMAIEAEIKQNPGTVLIMDSDGNVMSFVEVGILPDMIAVSPDHTKILTANEGEPTDNYTNDPEGSITVIDISSGVGVVTQSDVTTIGFDQFESFRQSFESSAWENLNYTISPSPYFSGNNRWAAAPTLNGISPANGNALWAASDLDNGLNNGQEWHTLHFLPVDISDRPRCTISFYYNASGYGIEDSLGYNILMPGETEFQESNYVALNNTSGWTKVSIPLDGIQGSIQWMLMTKHAGSGASVAFDDIRISFLDNSTRIFGNNDLSTVKADMEPEYITVSEDSQIAYVTCQENNALAILDLNTLEFIDVKGLGFKNHSLPENGLDASDQDGEINIQPHPVFGMYQPDAIDHFTTNGESFLITANEGDVRGYNAFNEEARINSLILDPTAFPDPFLVQPDILSGRLKVSSAMGDLDFDGDYDELYCFGSRSFSIWNGSGELVWDSGDDFEQKIAELFPDYFSSNNDDNTSFDSRSDDKGPEPEGITIGKIYNHTYAFVGLERMGGIMVYEITDPYNPVFIQYINSRNFDADANSDESIELAPEGIIFIPKNISPIDRDLVVLSCEVSGSISIYQVDVNLVVSGDVVVDEYTLLNSPVIGTSEGVEIHEGGFSGLFYVPGSENEFYAINDRGPNADANQNIHAGDEPVVVFATPEYAPKISRIQAINNEINILESNEILRPDGTSTTGLPLPLGNGNSGEITWADTSATLLGTDSWGMDPEGILITNDEHYWVCEEYGSAILKLDLSGKVVKRYTPFPSQPEDLPLDSIIGMRRPNRGFEGIARTPNGKIYAILQSPANNPDAPSGLLSQMHRIVELDPVTEEMHYYAYVHRAAVGEIREQDWKIGDMVAINNDELLLIEHAQRNGWNYKNIVKIRVTGATPFTTETVGDVTLEQLGTYQALIEEGYTPVERTVFADLIEMNWEEDQDKPEGLAIIDQTTIAVITDNDFGITSTNEDGVISESGKESKLFIYHLPSDWQLNFVSPFCELVVSEDTGICPGDSAMLVASGDFDTVIWNDSVYANDFWVYGNGVVEVSASTSEVCIDREQISIELFENPQPTIGEDVVLCEDSLIVLQLDQNYATQIWSTGGEADSTLVSALELGQGVYEISIEVTNDFGCVGSDTLFVQVVSNPELLLEAQYTICEGEDVVLDCQNDTDSLLWNTTETTPTITVNDAGNYAVVATNIFGCTALAETELIVNPLPLVELGPDLEIPFGSSATLDAGDFPEILWSTGEETSSIVVDESGVYSVEVTDTNGCSAADELEVTVLTDVALLSDIGIEMYPNPATSILYIQSNDDIETIQFVDSSGRICLDHTCTRDASGVDISSLANGFYLVNVQTNKAFYRIRIMKN
ncbi:MAG: choice-of-anchor I family protein [Flavobacteriales bacterium]